MGPTLSELRVLENPSNSSQILGACIGVSPHTIGEFYCVGRSMDVDLRGVFGVYTHEELRKLRRFEYLATEINTIDPPFWTVVPESHFKDVLDEFLCLESSNESIVAFSDKYGMLAQRKFAYIGVTAQEGDYQTYLCEPIEYWYRNLDDIRFAFKLYRLIQNKNEVALQDCVLTSDMPELQLETHYELAEARGFVLPTMIKKETLLTIKRQQEKGYPIEPEFEYIDSHFVRAGVSIHPKTRKPNVTDAARAYLQRLVEGYLNINTFSALRWDVKRKQYGIETRVASLAGHIWLQFAQMMARGTEFRVCGNCGHEFIVSGRKRSDTKWCSDACKQEAYRLRKEVKNVSVPHPTPESGLP